jgi:hypothetical protein
MKLVVAVLSLLDTLYTGCMDSSTEDTQNNAYLYAGSFVNRPETYVYR